jgi:hypothetical protein
MMIEVRDEKEKVEKVLIRHSLVGRRRFGDWGSFGW